MVTGYRSPRDIQTPELVASVDGQATSIGILRHVWRHPEPADFCTNSYTSIRGRSATTQADRGSVRLKEDVGGLRRTRHRGTPQVGVFFHADRSGLQSGVDTQAVDCGWLSAPTANSRARALRGRKISRLSPFFASRYSDDLHNEGGRSYAPLLPTTRSSPPRHSLGCI
jgi:hypothetical protein